MANIAVLLGSKSDLPFVEAAEIYFKYFNLDYEIRISSAHRNPNEVAEFCESAKENGFKVIIAGAGMAAHLAGAVAAHTTLPVLGVPLPGGIMDGMDALLSTVQMPAGVPVATFAVGKAGMRNAVVFAAQLLAVNDETIHQKLIDFKKQGSRL
ncbi:MAG: 5-(carboxyamino)imidazole ribonucleotide mutase [Calditrichaeota bacterium]|nr:MAG: 5-(carboxyamino)imidazole ribonucleotide mutase [Calditrichota bacterium]MBL1207577.1 5-(carboxyamino)imidazole ribonucleotide mutase [Calditrichota bacterium]NOG47409.1 5-(carboxyamino)imidazole ribonucleotide mutase [Calditrichota bacterium]